MAIGDLSLGSSQGFCRQALGFEFHAWFGCGALLEMLAVSLYGHLSPNSIGFREGERFKCYHTGLY